MRGAGDGGGGGEEGDGVKGMVFEQVNASKGWIRGFP